MCLIAAIPAFFSNSFAAISAALAAVFVAASAAVFAAASAVSFASASAAAFTAASAATFSAALLTALPSTAPKDSSKDTVWLFFLAQNLCSRIYSTIGSSFLITLFIQPIHELSSFS
jgi:hypothetical protein